MSEFKLKHNRIGVLTSGGDCAGLNAAIRAITYRAIQEYGLTVVGILASTAGLLQRPVRYRDLTMDNVDSGFLREGGTVLETVNKGNPFEYPMPDGSIKDRSMEAIEGFHALDLDALIGIGGDGSAHPRPPRRAGTDPVHRRAEDDRQRPRRNRLRHRLHERGRGLRGRGRPPAPPQPATGGRWCWR